MLSNMEVFSTWWDDSENEVMATVVAWRLALADQDKIPIGFADQYFHRVSWKMLLGSFWGSKGGQRFLRKTLRENRVFRLAALKYGSPYFLTRKDRQTIFGIFFRMESYIIVSGGYLQEWLLFLETVRGKKERLVSEIQCILDTTQNMSRVRTQLVEE